MMSLSGCNPIVSLEASVQRERKSTPGHIMVKLQKNQREILKVVRKRVTSKELLLE